MEVGSTVDLFDRGNILNITAQGKKKRDNTFSKSQINKSDIYTYTLDDKNIELISCCQHNLA